MVRPGLRPSGSHKEGSMEKTYNYSVEKYEAYIHESASGKQICIKSKNGIISKTFSGLATSKKPKVYIIKNYRGKPVYIGKSKQSLSNRLRQGLNAEGNNGYHGYKWKNKDEISIICIGFDETIDNVDEIVEAEIVFQIRLKTNYWPEYQTEIHFHNDDIGKDTGIKIYRELIGI
jgi:hypothetical protein